MPKRSVCRRTRRSPRLLEEVERANRDDAVDGILVQLPLPPGHDARRVFDSIDPVKDVDGLHPENVGLLVQGRPRFVPCTAAGILALLDAYEISIAGANAAVLGRSEIVGKPVAALLTSRNATVTLCHSKTKDLAGDLPPRGHPRRRHRKAGIRHERIRSGGRGRRGRRHQPAGEPRAGAARTSGSPGAWRMPSPGTDARSSATWTSTAVSRVASWITPVPGGVGPLTIAMLLQNTVDAARRRSSV